LRTRIACQHKRIRIAINHLARGLAIYLGGRAQVFHNARVEEEAADLPGPNEDLRMKAFAGHVVHQRVSQLPRYRIRSVGFGYINRRHQQFAVANRALKDHGQFIIAIPIIDSPDRRPDVFR